jgi:capsular polysaccharide biosynthesis protein
MSRWQRRRSLEELVDRPTLFGGHNRVQHVHSLGPEQVRLPELQRGSTFFNHMTTREVPAPGLWRSNQYHSVAPALFVINDVVVHSSPGILAVGDYVVSESLDHTDTYLHGFIASEQGVKLHARAMEHVDAVAICILAGSCESVYHWIVDAVGRLGVIPAKYRQAASVLLISDSVPLEQRRLLGRLLSLHGLTVKAVRVDEALRVRTLLVPTSVSAEFRYHPCLRTTVRGALDHTQVIRTWSKRIYIDRRGASARRLVNESELVEQLERMGILAVALEQLTLGEQIELFRSAELIIAPHGAGLTNCIFAPPGCRIVELLMDSYVNWCFRNLAGLCGLEYDCIIGRTLHEWTQMSPAVHGSQWVVSITHVAAAVADLTKL